MKTIWVCDPGNFRYAWVANECTKHPNSIIFTFSRWSEYMMELFLLRYGVTDVPTKRFTNFFFELINMSPVTVAQTVSKIRHRRLIFNNSLSNDATIREYINLYLNMQRFMAKDMKSYCEFLGLSPNYTKQAIEFANTFDEHIRVTPLSGIIAALKRRSKFKKDTIFIIGLEDLYPLAIKAIYKVFDCENLYLVGDEEKAIQYSKLWRPITDGKLKVDEMIDLSPSVSMPKEIHNLCDQITSAIGISCRFQRSSADGVFKVTEDESEIIDRLNNRDYQLAVICQNDFQLGMHIEGFLNRNGIPFWTSARKGEIPENLAVFYYVMRALESGHGMISRGQILKLLYALNPSVTALFGGLTQLRRHFSSYQIPVETLKHMSLFKFLYEKWTEKMEPIVLRDCYRPKAMFAKARSKHPDWKNPRLITCHVREAKNLRPDITFYLLYHWADVYTFSEWMLRWLYSMVTVTSKEFWVLPIGQKLGLTES